MTVRELLVLPTSGAPVDLAALHPRSTPGFDGKKARARAELAALAPRLAALQERLYAEGRTGGRRRVVLVLQAMDTGGKDGVVKHVVGLVNPAGVTVTSFGRPTEEELAHDFLWRVERALPPPGVLGVFNRSHYEDVLVVRVHDLVPQQEWEARYDLINAWEAEQAEQGVVLVKVFLHVSREEQRERLLARLDDPAKHWKVDPADIGERRLWPQYQEAFQTAFERCSTRVAPWHVLPADRTWYRDWALAHLLVEVLEGLDPQWPQPEGLDVDGLRQALQEDD
jgi:PPK2 family polyphosphate:nucleotide phosphotransferase